MDQLCILKFQNDVRELLQGYLSVVDRIDGIIIVGLTKDGGTFLATSTMSGQEKAWLQSFMNHAMDKYHEQGQGPKEIK